MKCEGSCPPANVDPDLSQVGGNRKKNNRSKQNKSHSKSRNQRRNNSNLYFKYY
jgi:hypothetical protein